MNIFNDKDEILQIINTKHEFYNLKKASEKINQSCYITTL